MSLIVALPMAALISIVIVLIIAFLTRNIKGESFYS